MAPRPGSPYGDRWSADDSVRSASDTEYSDEESRSQYRKKNKGRRRRSHSRRRAPPPVTIAYDKDGKRLSDSSKTADKAEDQAPDVLWRLAIRRHKRDDHSGTSKDLRVSYVGEKPFEFKVLSDDELGLTSVRAAKAHEPIRKPVFEVITSVLDSRFTLKDEHRDADIHDLQISKVYHEEIKIWSEPVRNALENAVDYYPAFPPHTFEKALEVREPYGVLMHHYPDIDRIATAGAVRDDFQCDEDFTEDEMKTLVKHMTVLRDFLKVQYEKQVLPCIEALSQSVPKVRFDMLWYLFRPGETVYVDGLKDVYACVIQSVSQHSGNISLDMWCMDTDGTRVARVSRHYTLYRFAGIRSVISLPVCPVATWDAHDGGLRKEHILQRSAMYLKGLRARGLYAWYKGSDYTGEVVIDHLHEHSTWEDDNNPDRMYIPSPPAHNKWDVFDGYFAKYANYNNIYLREEDNPAPPMNTYTSDDGESFDGDYDSCDDVEREPPMGSEGSSPFTHDDYTPTQSRRGSISPPPPPPPMMVAPPKMHGTTEVTEHQLLLLYPEAPAFCLNTKRWIRVRLDNVREMQVSDESINNLVLEDASQQILRAMSTRQSANGAQWSADFVESKGAAQIILLHGPPGVGKTYTVESIANWLGRPLLALTVGDLGTQETKIEQRLTKWFDLAEAWKAVLLVDEAEVFLEKRKNRDLARNGLVAAFLRRLEYFSGLLFLTTNRVSQIDDAFMSRLHIAIGYKTLTPSARKAIWKGFFRKLDAERTGRISISDAAKEYVLEDEEVERIDLNGREIRNALQTAIALAEYEHASVVNVLGDVPVLVNKTHFQKVLKTSQAFHDHVVGLRREEEA